ncbi:MAG: Hsp20/alpha crystallin family protein [Thermoplasmata archaeon]|nr:Hsp20/alpha crystallin family protein [Thermoplasmata archaeon]
MTEETPKAPRTLARRTQPVFGNDSDRLFEALWQRANAPFGLLPFDGPAGAPGIELDRSLRTAPTDVVDTGTAYQVRAEIPGVPKEQIEIRVKGNVVEISGENRSESTDNSSGYLHRERLVTGFHRALELPEPVVAAQAKAKVVDGVLELELPKQGPTPSPAETTVKVE